ncbi:hypothetical protein [Moellerella wisconsensis]|uniref:Uncharacterized protein n=1 Tax=Moellerella wisconsensis TaxID=158849 RepID=A0ACD3Y5J0_9GAMM|nr:hypothetical protein [Moellerella wisconsensis]UNH37694.1 hypothetical protein MNY70_09140 [Moellerella wisconsensis]
MKKTLPLIFICTAALSLSACAVKNDSTEFKGIGFTYNSDIEKTPDGNYVASVEAAPGAGRASGAVAYATTNASNYCQKQNKALKVLSDETSSNYLINGVAKVKFNCI